MSARFPTADPNGTAFGLACGATMALGASCSFAAARAGIVQGMAARDLILLRFLVAGVVFLPFLLVWGPRSLAGIGWRRGLVLLFVGGPLFSLLQTGGYAFAPLAHGAVIAPATVTILSTLMAAAFLRERLGAAHLIGAALVIAGILLLGWQGLTHPGGGQVWIGDLMFFASSVLWAGFSVLVRHWRLNAARAIGVVSVLSLAVVLPAYAAIDGIAHPLIFPASLLAVQALVQGGLQGVITITAYSHSIRVLGVSRAVLFPAAVPAVSVLIGIPITGEWPDAVQIGGLVLVTAGLLTAVGAIPMPGFALTAIRPPYGRGGVP